MSGEDSATDADDPAVEREGGPGGAGETTAGTWSTPDAANATDRVSTREVAAPVVDRGAPDADVDLSDPSLYLNRELSELSFQKRVLHEAVDERTPLLERVKFLAIFASNMDEFFMKRVGGLKQQMDARVTELTPDGRTPREQWTAILAESRAMFERQVRCYREVVEPALADAGIHVRDHDELTAAEQSSLRRYFEESVLPTLTPLTFDPAHPFPHISNLSLSLAVLTRSDADADLTFSRVKVPGNRSRLVRVGEGETYVPLEQVIAANLDLLFPDVDVVDHATFRVTRNAEVRRNEEVAEDLIEVIEEVLRERRFATVVRLEVESGTPDSVRELLVEQLGLDEREVFELDPPLDLRDLMPIAELDRPELSQEPWTPQPHPRLSSPRPDETVDVFERIREGDVLVHHPYHSFDKTVQRFLDEAASDPDVLAIKAAIYRTASDSQVIESLIEAAHNGKQVAVMVELKARFDEEANLEWVERLEEEGIHVAYGTIGYKTHTKTALVVREEGDAEAAAVDDPGAADGSTVRLYSHVATGNYHSETAKTYVDLGLLTADADVGQDLVRLFNFFTGHSMHESYRTLLTAPGDMREEFVRLIRREVEHAREGKGGRIVAKMNRLEDPELVEELYAASRSGVEIDLVVRDICRLRPGLEGVSETIRVHSVVGRFLEHSRIFLFENAGDPEYYIGSADWMTRNLDNRVEAVVPIEDPELQSSLRTVLETNLADNRKRWRMQPDGTYRLQQPAAGAAATSVQEQSMRLARGGATLGRRWNRPVEDDQ